MTKQTTQEVLTALFNKTYIHEYGLIQKKVLVYERHNDKVIFFVGKPAQEGYCDASQARYWYRAMTPEQFKWLRKFDAIYQEESYGGIATNSEYVKNYMGNKSSQTHLVEFDVIPPLDLFTEFERLMPVAHPKAEGDGGTYGLGKTGHHQGRNGEMFNNWLAESHITWQLVYLILPNPYAD